MDELIANDPAKIDALMSAIRSGEPLPLWQFARVTGTKEGAVVRAWRQGVLPSVPGDRIPIREGVVALVSAGGLRPRRQVPVFLYDADTLARALLGLPDRELGDAEQEDPDAGEVKKWKLQYLKAQTAARLAAATARQRENDKARGKLIEAEEVALDAAETAANVARLLCQIPERVAGMCAGKTAEEIAVIVRAEILLVIDTIQASAFTGDWGGIV